MKTKDSVVKIDSELLGEVEEFINLNKNKFMYVNRKQFIDIAVAEFLRREKGGKKMYGIKIRPMAKRMKK